LKTPEVCNFETYGQAAAAEVQKTQQLLAEIEQALNSPPGPLSLKKRGELVGWKLENLSSKEPPKPFLF
jgi:hypothetical protein